MSSFSDSTKKNRSYLFENYDQYSRLLLDVNSFPSDIQTAFQDIKNPIQEMEKKGVTYYPKIFQFLNKKARLNHEKVKELLDELLHVLANKRIQELTMKYAKLPKNELDKIISKCIHRKKTTKNINASFINANLSYAAFINPTGTFHYILNYIFKVKRTNISIYEEDLKILIDSVSNQITQSDENNDVDQLESIQDAEASQIDLNQINEVTSETGADQFVNTQTEIIQNSKNHLNNLNTFENCEFENGQNTEYADQFGNMQNTEYADQSGNMQNTEYADQFGNMQNTEYSDQFGNMQNTEYADQFGNMQNTEYADQFGNMQNGDNHNDDDGNENEYYIYNPLTDIL